MISLCLTKQALQSVACNSTDCAPFGSWLGNVIHWAMLKTLTYRPPQGYCASTSDNILIKKQKRPQQNLQRPKTKQKIKYLGKYAWKQKHKKRVRVWRNRIFCEAKTGFVYCCLFINPSDIFFPLLHLFLFSPPLS